MCDDIEPGAAPGYETCKIIYLYHPVGAKMVEKPVKIAMSQSREVTVEGHPDEVKEAFIAEWDKRALNPMVFNTRVLSKVYGITTLAVKVEGQPPENALELKDIHKREVVFSIFDPLNTAGSLVLSQDPLAFDFQKPREVSVNGQVFHRSKTCVVMNEFPIYIAWTSSAFGFVGRSAYQRSLLPLKSYVQTMITNDLISRKSGVIIAKIKQGGSVINEGMLGMLGIKRNVVKVAEVTNVVSIDVDEFIESIDLKNLSEPYAKAREFIIQDITSGAPMPSKMLSEESYAAGFGEGSEDAKEMARFIDGEREGMEPIYRFLHPFVWRFAWTPEFYEGLKEKYPERYVGVSYNAAFYSFVNGFRSTWPSLLTEPDSEKVKVDDVKLKALIAIYEVMRTDLDPDNKAQLIQWVADGFNELRLLFGSPLVLDWDALASYTPPEQDAVEGPDKPFSSKDSALHKYNESLGVLLEHYRKKNPKLKVV